MSTAALELSVVLPTDSFETIRDTVACLCAQTVAGRLELVVVAPSAEGVALPEAVGDRLGAVRVIEVGETDFQGLHRARAAGVRAASAPVVVFGETHSFPEPGWAEALLAAHRSGWAAVGPSVLNANPASAISRANLAVDFGPWVELGESRTMSDLAGHNSSYRRDLLVGLGRRLDSLIRSDTLLNETLRDDGHDLYAHAAARTRHLNLTGWFWILERFDHDRLWAVKRSESWSWPRRLLYVAGSPLIPWIRLGRILPEVRRAGHGRDVPQLAFIVIGLVAGAVGEAAGYAVRRPGASVRRLHDVELHRTRYAPDWPGVERAFGVPE